MNCPICKSSMWNPFSACQRCGYSIEFTLENPSPYQRGQKWPKHGLLYTGSGTIIDPSAWGKAPGTKFISTLDLTRSFETVAASGNILVSQDSARDESYVFYMGSLTGGGALDGQWRDFYAIRLVKPNNFDEVHIFPDNIRSFVDKEIVCGKCGRGFVVSTRPHFCPCGNLLRWS